MTDEQWFAAERWRSLLGRVRRRKNYARKARLFSVACCRRIAHLFEEPKCDEAVAVAEQFADGEASKERLEQAARAAHATVVGHQPLLQAWARDAAWRTTLASGYWEGAESCLRAVSYDPAEQKAQLALFRDIFRSPARRPKCKPAWLTSDVLALARGIYEDRAFDRMPILADALQDAGCTDEELLAHCRGEGPHVRGCWVVDLLLGKE